MIWQYQEWTTAFIIQFFAILVAFIYGIKNGVKKEDLFIVISLVSPVALFTVSAGVSGSLLLSDVVAIYLLIKTRYKIKLIIPVIFTLILFVIWPIWSTFNVIVYQPFSDINIFHDNKIFSIQLLRYFLYFILFSKLICNPYLKATYILKLFKVQAILLFFVFSAILMGYFKIIEVDVWNQLIEQDFYGETLGSGGMFLYRGGVGTLGTIAIPIVYFCYYNSKGFFKFLMGLLIYIIITTVLFSGSRQGITFSLCALFLSMFFFKQYKKALQFSLIGVLFGMVLLQNENIKNTSDWVLNRYEILLSDKIDVGNEVGERNTALDEAKKQRKDTFHEINGFGVGSSIVYTESDYYNTYSFFGVIGSIIYYLFILYCIVKIYFKWRNTNDLFYKNIIAVALIGSIVIPLYGFQQWYIMTYGATNSMNIYLTLFIYSLAMNSKKSLPHKIKTSN